MTQSASTARETRSLPPPAAWKEGVWWSQDGLRLHYRDYAGPAGSDDLPPVLCLPGLTRNARDYEDVARDLCRTRRVIAVDFRGRGGSAYAKDPMTYAPLTYVQDVIALLDDQKLTQIVAVGTSLGGLCIMLLSALRPGCLAGAVLNDVGPELDPAGIERIKSYVGVGGSQPTWLHAARHLADSASAIFPDFAIEDWLRMVKRSHRLTSDGRIVADYDKQIAVPLKAAAADQAPDMWPVLDHLAAVPMLIVRGAMSDILSPEICAKMLERLPLANAVEVPRVGHAPTLDEPVARAAITGFIAAL